MALRVGIHSDSRLKDNCLEYNAFPVGFANADFEGGSGNPYLSGIKPPKYQRSAPKPVSADVMAVNSARFMQGNQRNNARGILSQFQKEAKVWKPPPVKLLSASEEWDRVYDELAKEGRESDVFDYQTREEVRKERNDRFYNTLQPKLRIPSRGTQMVVQTIATQAEIPSMDEILFRYSNLASKEIQQQKFTKAMKAVENQGIMLPDLSWTKAQYGTIPERRQQLRYLIERAFAQGSNVNLIDAFTVQLDELPGAGSVKEGYFSSTRPESVSSGGAGTSTAASAATTQQGVAQPSTSSLTQEVQRK